MKKGLKHGEADGIPRELRQSRSSSLMKKGLKLLTTTERAEHPL